MFDDHVDGDFVFNASGHDDVWDPNVSAVGGYFEGKGGDTCIFTLRLYIALEIRLHKCEPLLNTAFNVSAARPHVTGDFAVDLASAY